MVCVQKFGSQLDTWKRITKNHSPFLCEVILQLCHADNKALYKPIKITVQLIIQMLLYINLFSAFIMSFTFLFLNSPKIWPRSLPSASQCLFGTGQNCIL